jgi:hypothetical protein
MSRIAWRAILQRVVVMGRFSSAWRRDHPWNWDDAIAIDASYCLDRWITGENEL